MTGRFAMLAARGDSTNIVANELRKQFGDFPLLLETREPAWKMLRRRARRLGYWTVAGQAMFLAAAAPWLRHRGARRIAEIERQCGLDASAVRSNVVYVGSANSEEAIARLGALDPELVVVNGTRILSRRVLGSISGRFLNMHAGITPAFRGCHGAYWALAAGQPHLAGVTVHWMDAGIDTGRVVKQAVIRPAATDNFVTYPYLQLAVGLPLLVETIREFFAGQVREVAVEPGVAAGSQLYYHPTLWAYLSGRLLRGVR